LESLKKRRAELTEEVDSAKKARTDTAECADKLKELGDLKKRKAELQVEAEQLSSTDAALFQEIGNAARGPTALAWILAEPWTVDCSRGMAC